MNNFTNLISIINNALQTSQAICIIKKTKQVKQLLGPLVKIGLICQIQSTPRFWIITLNNSGSGIFNVSYFTCRALSKPSKACRVTLYQLQSLLWLNRTTVYLVSTSMGEILTGEECLRLNRAGILVAAITFK